MKEKYILKKKLKSYSVFAISALAKFNSVDAQIIYTDIPDTTLNLPGESFSIDMDGDFNNDFSIDWNGNIVSTSSSKGYFYGTVGYGFINAPVSNGVMGSAAAAVLSSGASISSVAGFATAPFLGGGYFAKQVYYYPYSANGYTNSGTFGNWPNNANKFLGVKFKTAGNIYYGWARCSMASDGLSMIIHDYAYNSCIGQKIKAGQTGLTASPYLANIETSTIIFLQNDPATVITTALTLTMDAENCKGIDSASVKITNGYISGEDTLIFVNTGTITGTFDAANGELKLVGNDTQANYEAALRTVQYDNLAATLTPGNRLVDFIVVEAVSGVVSNISSRDINLPIPNTINESDLEVGINLYPNPTNDMINLSIDNDIEGFMDIEILDIIGRKIYTLKDNKTTNSYKKVIDISTIESGVYLIKITTENYKVVNRLQKSN